MCFFLLGKEEVSLSKFFLLLEHAIIMAPSFDKLLYISSPIPLLAPVIYAYLFFIL